MEDYTINEINNNTNKILLAIEDNEEYIKRFILNSNIELMPLRFSYDLSCFSDEYQDKTKELFSFYYNKENNMKNEMLRLKKHFKHYMRTPNIVYIKEENNYLCDIFNELKIEYTNDLETAVKKLNNNSKIFFIDIDDTLTNSEGIITEKTKQSIKNTLNKGNKVVITTARPRYYANNIATELNIKNSIISLNGADIFFDNNTSINYYIDIDDVCELIEDAYKLDVRLIISTDDIEYVTKKIRNSHQVLLERTNYLNQISYKKIKTIMLIDRNADAIKKIKHKVLNNNKLTIINEKENNDTWIEEWFTIGNENASKGNAVLKVADYYNVLYCNTICIGNGKNDLSMFEKAGISVAMDNSMDEIKKNVNEVTKSNDEDGVALIIDKYS